MTCSRSQSQLAGSFFCWGQGPKTFCSVPSTSAAPCCSPWPSFVFIITDPVPRNPSLAPLASGPVSAQLSKLCSQAVTQLKPGLSIGSWSFLYDMGLGFHSPALLGRQLVPRKEQEAGARQSRVEIQLVKCPHLPELPVHHF